MARGNQRNKQFDVAIRENIRSVMREKDLKNKDIANIFGVSVPMITQWLNGQKNLDINIYQLNALCEAYDISSDYVLGYTPNQSRNDDDKPMSKKIRLCDKAINNLEKAWKIFANGVKKNGAPIHKDNAHEYEKALNNFVASSYFLLVMEQLTKAEQLIDGFSMSFDTLPSADKKIVLEIAKKGFEQVAIAYDSGCYAYYPSTRTDMVNACGNNAGFIINEYIRNRVLHHKKKGESKNGKH